MLGFLYIFVNALCSDSENRLISKLKINTAVHCVMIGIVGILDLNYGTARWSEKWISIVHMVYQCALGCCW